MKKLLNEYLSIIGCDYHLKKKDIQFIRDNIKNIKVRTLIKDNVEYEYRNYIDEILLSTINNRLNIVQLIRAKLVLLKINKAFDIELYNIQTIILLIAIYGN